MRIERIVAAHTDDGLDVHAYCQAAKQSLAQELWLRVRPAVPVPEPLGDVFLAATLLPSMIAGEDLHIDGKLSQALLSSSDQIQAIYARWVKGANSIRVLSASETTSTSSVATREGSFFSAGVDSFYTLNKHRDKIKDLILVQGFDVALDDHWRYQQARAAVAEVARVEGKGLIEVSTNIRQFMDRFVSWDYSHGAALAAVALACSGLLRKVYIPASYPYDWLFPFGSHPLLDPLWSNGLVQIVHDGNEAGRLEKVMVAVRTSPLALRTLRVCWKNEHLQYNCGHCEKCLRNMLCLYAAGVLNQCTTLPHRFSALSVAWMNFKYRVGLAEELLSAIKGNKPLDRQLRLALRIAILRTRLALAWRAICGKG